MLVVGITGGIGCGKSKILYQLSSIKSFFVCETDKLAHELMKSGTDINREIYEAFGKEILDENGNIDRVKLGEKVFSDNRLLEELNSIVHPGVKSYILNDIEKKRENGFELYIIEAALLLQDGYREICDEIWYIWASKEKRIERLMEGRAYTYEKCISVMSNQPKDEYYKKYADFTINNDLDFDFSSKQLNEKLNNMIQCGKITHICFD